MIVTEFTSFYFYFSLVGYAVGLLGTFAAMAALKTAQPALLYILPSMLIFYLMGAFGKKELIKMVTYDEDTELS